MSERDFYQEARAVLCRCGTPENHDSGVYMPELDDINVVRVAARLQADAERYERDKSTWESSLAAIGAECEKRHERIRDLEAQLALANDAMCMVRDRCTCGAGMAAVRAARRERSGSPLPPDVMVSALQDRVHKETGISRPAKSVKSERSGEGAE